MATVRNNLLVSGLSGMLGNTIVFKKWQGKTLVTSRPRAPRKQSAQQKANRSRFRQATLFARQAMLNAEMKAYYQAKAKKLKLPNAYTAAITDYMRSPQVKKTNIVGNRVTYSIAKRNFDLKKVAITVPGSGARVYPAVHQSGGEWTVALTHEALQQGASIVMEDSAGTIWYSDIYVSAESSALGYSAGRASREVK